MKYESKTVTDMLRKGRHTTKIGQNRKFVSFDVVSLYMNVPESKATCFGAEKRYELEDVPPVDKDTFLILTNRCCSEVLLRSKARMFKKMDWQRGLNLIYCSQILGYLNLTILLKEMGRSTFVTWMTS